LGAIDLVDFFLNFGEGWVLGKFWVGKVGLGMGLRFK